ncbi:putative RNA methyltransferase At5g51130 [Senna tora]|uniref:Putative RNA methyltransferase At5g51130 n=1 Tax=Senna tora TaxID=362788 RepID=A0A834TMR3_9FABA|nr:putative RNA methyltransferase At5g51130 [Senna tora]
MNSNLSGSIPLNSGKTNHIDARIWSFLWWACTDILPMCTVLVSRGLEMEERCNFCMIDEETGFQVLVNCSVVQEVWDSSRFDYSSRKWHNLVVDWLDMEGFRLLGGTMSKCVYVRWPSINMGAEESQ